MLVLGIMGMPRRYADYLPQFQRSDLTSTIGSWILVAGMMLMFYNLIRAIRHGRPAATIPGAGPPWSGRPRRRRRS